MCAMANPVPFRKVHTSIIKPVISFDSQYSDCISDDDNNHHHRNSSNLSLDTDSITQKIRPCSQDDNDSMNVCCNNDISPENVTKRSESFSVHSSRSRSTHKPFLTPSINSNRRRNGQSRRTCSTDKLSHPPLRETTTTDSGTGGSVTILATLLNPEQIQYEIVPVFGQAKTALMANRYDFDPAKIAAYKNSKRFLPEKTSTSTKRNSGESKKTSTLFSRFLKPFKSSTSEQTQFVRHHISTNTFDQNH